MPGGTELLYIKKERKRLRHWRGGAGEKREASGRKPGEAAS